MQRFLKRWFRYPEDYLTYWYVYSKNISYCTKYGTGVLYLPGCFDDAWNMPHAFDMFALAEALEDMNCSRIEKQDDGLIFSPPHDRRVRTTIKLKVKRFNSNSVVKEVEASRNGGHYFMHCYYDDKFLSILTVVKKVLKHLKYGAL